MHRGIDSRFAAFIVLLCVATIVVTSPSVGAQGVDEIRRPIDMFIVVDNSGSMFGSDGNDPTTLRVVGADLFIARLGFGDANAADYQAGIISMGSAPEIVAPLQPLDPVRGYLAQLISDPPNAGGTQIVESLELAYRELRTSPNRRSGNLPAIILLTDGVPDPPEGQSQADIEQLVAENSDIPLFVMLLQNRVGGSSPEYQAYIQFWQSLQGRSSHIFVYQVADAEEIEDTYNRVIAQLQNTVPSEGFPVVPGSPVNVYVSRYVQRLIVTIVHDREADARGNVEITDPSGALVTDADPDVSHFDDPDNPVEVVSIGSRRIGTLVDDVWTIRSDAPVMVFLDRQGAYNIDFDAPVVSLTDVTNVYLAVDRHSPIEELVIRFRLMDEGGLPVPDPQPIHGVVFHPDGSEAEMRIPADLVPDAEGVYEITYDYSTYPNALSEAGRYTFVFEAGQANEGEGERVPVTVARLLVDSGRGVFIQDVTPSPIICQAGAPATMTVTVGDAEIADMNTAFLRVFGSGVEVTLTRSGENTFVGDMADLCTPLLSGLSCSSTAESSFRLRLVARGPDGNALAPSERDVQVQVIALPCTPTPTPTPVPPPPPTPTPIPDSDGDGQNDLVDSCPGDSGLEMFAGCPPPIWFWIAAGVLALGLLALLIFVVWPLVRITLSPPPKGYVLVCRAGKNRPEQPRDVYSIGRKKRKNQITIGGDKKDDIYVKDLQPGEFVVKKEGSKVVLMSGSKPTTFDNDPNPVPVYTSQTDVTLKVGLDRGKLR